MANINLVQEIRIDLTPAEYKLIGFALRAGALGEVVKGTKIREEMRVLNLKLMELHYKELSEKLDVVRGAFNKACEIPEVTIVQGEDNE